MFLTDGAASDPTRLDRWCAGFDEQLALRDILSDDAAVHIYSSGTTGRPKGVVLTHLGLMSACQATAQAWALDQGSVLGHVLPTFHIAGLLMLLFPVYVGCRCVAFREFQPDAVLEALSGQKITHVLVVPAMIGFLLARPASRTLDFGSLRRMAYAGSPITEPVLQAAMEVFGCDFSQIYGLTEVSGVVTNLTPEDHRRGAELLRSAGRPLPRTALRIVDPVTLADMADGRVGEAATATSRPTGRSRKPRWRPIRKGATPRAAGFAQAMPATCRTAIFS